jgi:probable phosphoglycerate mutase
VRLLLVRHAQIPSNVLGVLDTDRPGPSLTALGREQAAALGETLADEPIEAAFASTLIRTRETLAPTAERHGLEPRLLDGLREIRAGDLEGERTREAQRAYMHTVFRWANGEREVAMPGGETGEQFFARFDAALAEVAASGVADAVVVSHGAAIRCWSATVAGADRDFLATHPLPNTGIVALEGEPGEWRMREWREFPAGQPVLVPGVHDDPTGSGG